MQVKYVVVSKHILNVFINHFWTHGARNTLQYSINKKWGKERETITKWIHC